MQRYLKLKAMQLHYLGIFNLLCFFKSAFKDIDIFATNLSCLSSGTGKVFKSFSSCWSCLSICLRLFSRFSAETKIQNIHSVNTVNKTHSFQNARVKTLPKSTQYIVNSDIKAHWTNYNARWGGHSTMFSSPHLCRFLILTGFMLFEYFHLFLCIRFCIVINPLY